MIRTEYKVATLTVLFICACTSINKLRLLERSSIASVYLIKTDGGSGSGFPVSSKCLVTADHVVRGDEDSVLVEDHDKKDHAAKVIRSSKEADVAVICTTDMKMVPVKLAKTLPELYDGVFTIGNPLSYKNIMTEGTYEGVYENKSMFSAPIAPGNSGGPVFNTDGEVIGLADAVALYKPDQITKMIFPHLAIMVPVSTIKEFVIDIYEGGA